ncbi:hypothetical protein NM208_g4026 [Fusarium decemcellulare]|uniref:Uncharacterized protein n=1 Tax=Fusarium decemcellulare TaxID=57161 RepID=A0ACC1SMI0_9HYPO|nr:hypothetical protein NM208_g4026 [Fusarium decemcellulare]
MDYEFSDIQTIWQNQTHMQYESPLITSRGIIATVLLFTDYFGGCLAFVHTGAYIYEVPENNPYSKAPTPLLGAPKEFSVCGALHERANQHASSSRSPQPIHSDGLQPVIMERYKRFVVFCLDPRDIQSFEPRKVCLSIVSGDLNSELSTGHLSMARHMPIRVLDIHQQHSLSIIASPVTQMRCTENADGYDIELPIGTVAFGSFNQLFNPWNSVRVLGVSRLTVECLQLDYDEVYDEGREEQQPEAPKTFGTFLYVGWGVCDEIQRLYCTLAPTTKSEFAILDTDRTKFTDRQYMHDWSVVTWYQ